jgi:hypothetical protein
MLDCCALTGLYIGLYYRCPRPAAWAIVFRPLQGYVFGFRLKPRPTAWAIVFHPLQGYIIGLYYFVPGLQPGLLYFPFRGFYDAFLKSFGETPVLALKIFVKWEGCSNPKS